MALNRFFENQTPAKQNNTTGPRGQHHGVHAFQKALSKVLGFPFRFPKVFEGVFASRELQHKKERSKLITVTNKTLRAIGAVTNGNYLRFPISELQDPDEPESSNNGNYREYAEFWANSLEFRTSMSYHGDIEDFPERESLSEKEWNSELLNCILYALSL